MLKFARRVKEIPVRHDERISGSSRYNLTKLIFMLINLTLRYNRVILRLLVDLRLKKKDGPVYQIKRGIKNARESFQN